MIWLDTSRTLRAQWGTESPFSGPLICTGNGSTPTGFRQAPVRIKELKKMIWFNTSSACRHRHRTKSNETEWPKNLI
jgi:hypothetical protein